MGIQTNLEIRVIQCPRYMLLLKQKMFLGVSSVVRMTTRCGNSDYFRWYDEKTNTNIQFLMFLFFCVISFNAFRKILRLGNSAWDFLGVNFWSSEFFWFCGKPQGFFLVLLEALGNFLRFVGSPRDFFWFCWKP